MAAYMIVRVKVTDDARYGHYRKAVIPLIERFGGKRVPSEQAELLEGEQGGYRVVLFLFPSMDAIIEFWNSPDYRQVKELRRGAARMEIWAMPGPPEGRCAGHDIGVRSNFRGSRMKVADPSFVDAGPDPFLEFYADPDTI